MIVMKFGGTSVGDADRIRGVAALVAERARRGPLVVVSALSGVTNDLLAAARQAEAGDEGALARTLAGLEERHRSVAAALGLPAAALAEVEAELGRARDLTRGVRLVGECTDRSRDAIAGVGELISHRMVAAALRAQGLDAVAVDPRLVMRTDARFGEAAAEPDAVRALAAEHLAPLLARGAVPVTGGFVGATAEGLPTTLGRGGSDLSATLLGVALDAREVQIWTDVDGMMTADPRVVPEARVLASVSFQEASELAYFGAKVLHPATIRPAVERAIPVRVKNTLRPDAPGTAISAAAGGDDDRAAVRAVAWKNGIATVSLTSGRMLGAHGFLARVFEVFARHETPVDVVTTSEVSVSLTVDRTERLDRIAAELEQVARVRVERDTALVCLVGRGLLEHPELTGAVLATLEGIPLRMFCLGSSDVNLTLVVDQSHAAEAVRRLHARFLERAEEAAA